MTPAEMQRLEQILFRTDHGEEVLVPTQLDGLVAGVAVCPEPVPAEEWIAAALGPPGEAWFESPEEAQETRALLVAWHNDVLRRLGRPGGYAPLLDDDLDGSPLWEMWMEGFRRALALRPGAWDAFAEGEAAASLTRLRRLCAIAAQGPEPLDAEAHALDAEAPTLIAPCLETLHAARIALTGPRPPLAVPPKRPGRNDPCPCGSGRKYKACCRA